MRRRRQADCFSTWTKIQPNKFVTVWPASYGNYEFPFSMRAWVRLLSTLVWIISRHELPVYQRQLGTIYCLHNVLSSLYFHSRNLVQVVKIRSITSTWNFRDITYFFVLPVSLLSSDSAHTSTPLLLIGRVLQYSFMAPKSIVALYGNVHFLSCYSITWYIGACGSWASSNIFFPKELSLP